MGKIKQGILGGFSGKVGTVVGSQWRNLDVIRALPKQVRDPKTPKQMAQRERFRLVAGFMKVVRPMVSIGFEVSSGKSYDSNNAALAYNLRYAIAGEYPGQELDYPNVRLSMGSLEGVLNGALGTGNPNELELSWVDNSGIANARKTDSVMAAAYCKELNQAVILDGESSREDGAATLSLPDTFAGKEIYVWMAFRDGERKLTSNSAYLGVITAE
ncbi:MAG: DUF6266 family protein [Balneolales bacterium]|nr:DUF6266 family protein [Balneolales bacterium]